jgi:hypothetical protein
VALVKLHERILEDSLVYRVWQGPFAERKPLPLLAHNDVRRARR